MAKGERDSCSGRAMADDTRPNLPAMKSQDHWKSSPCSGTRRDMNQNLLQDVEKGKAAYLKEIRRAAAANGGSVQTKAEPYTAGMVSKGNNSDQSITRSNGISPSTSGTRAVPKGVMPNGPVVSVARTGAAGAAARQAPQMAMQPLPGISAHTRCFGVSVRTDPNARYRKCYGVYEVNYHLHNPTIPTIAEFLKKDAIVKLRVLGPYRGICWRKMSVHLRYRWGGRDVVDTLGKSTLSCQFSSEQDAQVVWNGSLLGSEDASKSKHPVSNTFAYVLSHPWQSTCASAGFVHARTNTFIKEWTEQHSPLHLGQKISCWADRTWKRWSKGRKPRGGKDD